MSIRSWEGAQLAYLGNRIPFAEELAADCFQSVSMRRMQTHLEVMNERLQPLFHHGAGCARAYGHSTLIAPVGILFRHYEPLSNENVPPIREHRPVDNSQTLPELLDPTQVAVVAVPVLPHRHIKLDLPAETPSAVARHQPNLTSRHIVVRRDLARSHFTPAAPQHNTRGTHTPALLCRNGAMPTGPGLPYSVGRHDFPRLVDASAELCRPP